MMAPGGSAPKLAPQPITHLIRRWRDGDPEALAAVAPLVQQQLRKLAASYLRRERREHTWQPTELVNEAYLQLMGDNRNFDWQSRSHFVAIAAQHMRQLLVDHARRRRALKRGSGAIAMQLDDVPAATQPPGTGVLDLHEALERLAQGDPRKARIMELKYFGGLEQREIAEVLAISVKTVEKDIHLAKAWLRSALTRTSPAASQ